MDRWEDVVVHEYRRELFQRRGAQGPLITVAALVEELISLAPVFGQLPIEREYDSSGARYNQQSALSFAERMKKCDQVYEKLQIAIEALPKEFRT